MNVREAMEIMYKYTCGKKVTRADLRASIEVMKSTLAEDDEPKPTKKATKKVSLD